MIIIGNTDITRYIVREGISETTEKVYDDNAADDYNAIPCKGIYLKYSFSLETVPLSVKSNLRSYASSADPISCTIDGCDLNADVDGYSAEIQFETAGIQLWKISLTVTDTELSKEASE